LTVNDDGRVQVWNVETGKRNWELDDSTLGIFHAAFTPDSQRVATFGQDDKLRIWHAATGEKIAERLLHGSDTPDNLVAQNTYLAFSPDGTEGAVSIGKYGIRRFDVHTGEALPTLSGALFYFSMAYSPDGRRLAVTYSNAASPTVGISADGGLQVWDTSTRKLVYDARGPFGSSIPFSLDGKYILTTHQDETARVWDANTGKLLHELKGHTAEINRAAFSPDGRFILTASSDASARVWEVATGKLVEILRGHSGIVTDASFSPDGKTIITTGDNTARLYECVACAPLDDLLAIANARITRELSCEERVTFLRETLECE
jgi:WD40 repeat protein